MSSPQLTFNNHDTQAFRNLPAAFRGFILSAATYIETFALRVCPGALPTSGWRCPTCNRATGGTPLSRHLWGCARDYRRSSVDPTRLLAECPPNLQIIDEPERGCVHIAYK